MGKGKSELFSVVFIIFFTNICF